VLAAGQIQHAKSEFSMTERAIARRHVLKGKIAAQGAMENTDAHRMDKTGSPF
jgi:hypothetical protein